jgi:hypothetical protein
MVSLTSKGSASEQQVEAVPVQNRGKFSRHCRRRWWVWLIAFCLFVLVIMIIIVYAIFPAVAQKELDKTYLTLHSLEIRDSTADSFSLSINSTISGASGIASHSHLDPMEISFYTQDSDTAFMTLPLPGINGGGDVPVVVQNVSTKINDLSAFGGFAGLLLESQDLSFKIKGRTTIHAGKLHSKVNYNEVVTMKGFNKLSGMEIQKYNFISNNSDANLAGKVFIPNPTVATIEMGNVHISFSHNGTALGSGTIPNLTITPGDRQYDFEAKLGNTALTTLLSIVVSEGNNATLTVKGNGTDINGTDIPWLSAPLAALEVSVPIDTPSS